jgi:phage gpG-like protein
MMRLVAHIQGMDRAFDVPIKALEDLTAPLKRAGKRVREAAKQSFAQGQSRSGGAWAPLAGSTQERLQQTTAGPVNVRGQVRAKYLRQARAGFERAVKAGKTTYLAREEFNRLVAGGSTKLSLEQDVPKALRSSAVRKLRRELEKTDDERRSGRRKSKKHRLLGQLAGGLRMAVKKGFVVVDHIVSWAGVHNEGGQVGHGAAVSARTFLELLEGDLTALIEDIFATLDGT